jgi:hypothetical protein
VAIVIIGWIVRTETAGRHRYWKVGEVNPGRAAQIARNTANAHVARAIVKLPAWDLPKIQLAPGMITEIVWETKGVAGPFPMPVLESDGGKTKGEITFDIAVPEDGVTIVEGCYRIDGGNWEVYIFAKQGSPINIFGRSEPHISPDAVFSSGISGVGGVVPNSWVLNKKTVMGMLAVAVGVEEWTEVDGLDSLILK